MIVYLLVLCLHMSSTSQFCQTEAVFSDMGQCQQMIHRLDDADKPPSNVSHDCQPQQVLGSIPGE